MTHPPLPAGAWDLYCHTSPCLLTRWGNATEVARAARRLGLGGLVLQSHHESTHGRAVAAQSAVSDRVLVLGGPTLNDYAGGLSAKAVRGALRAGARIVWLPTVDASAHVELLGAGMSTTGSFDPDIRGTGIGVLEGDGSVRIEVEEIVALLSAHRAVLCSGHVGLQEVEALVALTAHHGVRLVVNHPYFVLRPAYDWWDALPGHVYAQLAAVDEPDDPRMPALTDVVEVVARLGPHRCVLGSEARAPTHPFEQLARFCEALQRHGVSADAVRTMACDTPRALLGEPPCHDGRGTTG